MRKNLKTKLELEFEIQNFDPVKRESRLQHLHMLRQKAYKAMQMLQPFSPKLTGMVLDGSAVIHTHIRLHVFTAPEEIIIYFVNHNIPYDEGEQRVQLMNRNFTSFPMFCFYLAETAIELTVFPENSAKYITRCPSSGKRMPRADLTDLENLLK